MNWPLITLIAWLIIPPIYFCWMEKRGQFKELPIAMWGLVVFWLIMLLTLLNEVGV